MVTNPAMLFLIPSMESRPLSRSFVLKMSSISLGTRWRTSMISFYDMPKGKIKENFKNHMGSKSVTNQIFGRVFLDFFSFLRRLLILVNPAEDCVPGSAGNHAGKDAKQLAYAQLFRRCLNAFHIGADDGRPKFCIFFSEVVRQLLYRTPSLVCAFKGLG